jgi:hypothetical protein
MAVSISEIKAMLESVESYSPTIPLSYQKYHEIIRQLIEEVEAEKQLRVSRTPLPVCSFIRKK